MTDQNTDNTSGAGDTASRSGARRRFIAGAVCPSCGEMDRIVIEALGGDQTTRRCVACGFSDELMPASGSLPATRFTRPRDAERTAKGSAEGAVSRVRIIEPRKHD